MKKNNWIAPYDASSAFHAYVNKGIPDKSKVEAGWHIVFNTVLKSLDIPKNARKQLWEGLVNGNWKRLWLTDDEKAMGADYWLSELDADVFYCSDRWTIDRLTRCHWLYRQYIAACEKRD